MRSKILSASNKRGHPRSLKGSKKHKCTDPRLFLCHHRLVLPVIRKVGDLNLELTPSVFQMFFHPKSKLVRIYYVDLAKLVSPNCKLLAIAQNFAAVNCNIYGDQKFDQTLKSDLALAELNPLIVYAITLG
jgi:hypothetical protein